MLTPDDIFKIFISTAERTIGRQSRYHILHRTRLGEAEVRYVMCKILSENKIYHAIETPTNAKLRITGNTIDRSALVDLTLYEERDSQNPSVWVEFKRGQVDVKNIKKDLLKMFKENQPSLNGVCFFHIMPKLKEDKKRKNIDRILERARNSIIQKYRDSYNAQVNTGHSKWFILFILDGHGGKYYYHFENDLCSIKEFPNKEWKKPKKTKE